MCVDHVWHEYRCNIFLFRTRALASHAHLLSSDDADTIANVGVPVLIIHELQKIVVLVQANVVHARAGWPRQQRFEELRHL